MIRRRAVLALALTAATACLAAPPVARLAGANPDPAFHAALDQLRTRAQQAGIAPATIALAFRDLTAPDPRVLAMTRRQSEFSQSIGAYVEGAASPARVKTGQALAARWSAILDAVERRSGVPREIVVAVWGMESAFGANPGSTPVLRALATLASTGERQALFQDEFVAALRILQDEHLAPTDLTGSWAGALGQVQFMHSTFLADALDQDGDGRRDIWRSVPDCLASIANLLARSGWRPGLPPAFEVRLPPGLDLAAYRRPLADWSAAGVTQPNGRPMPADGDASLFLPAGIRGPAFLLTDNFEALRAYNTSDAYALGVTCLADAIGASGPLSRPWPTAPVLDAAGRREVQERLARKGLYVGTPDGRLGAKTRDAVRRFQVEQGLVADAYADADLLAALRRAP